MNLPVPKNKGGRPPGVKNKVKKPHKKHAPRVSIEQQLNVIKLATGSTLVELMGELINTARAKYMAGEDHRGYIQLMTHFSNKFTEELPKVVNVTSLTKDEATAILLDQSEAIHRKMLQYSKEKPETAAYAEKIEEEMDRDADAIDIECRVVETLTKTSSTE